MGLFAALVSWTAAASPLTLAEVTATRHSELCHAEVPWHCLRPVDGEVLVRVHVKAEVAWDEELKSVKLDHESVTLSTGETPRPAIAESELGLVEKVADTFLSRPYDYKKGAPARHLEWVFTAPAEATAAHLSLGEVEADVALDGEVLPAVDHSQFASFEVRYGRWVGEDVRTSERVLEGSKVRDHLGLACEVLGVGVGVRALEGTQGWLGTEHLTLNGRQFAVEVGGVTYPSVEQLAGDGWPEPFKDLYVRLGDEKMVELLFCVPDKTAPASLLYRGRGVGAIELPGAVAAPAPAPTSAACAVLPLGTVPAAGLAALLLRRRRRSPGAGPR